eukprot:PITA_36160
MATSGLRDQDRFDGASNYVIWTARMSFLLDKHALKTYVNNLVAKPADLDPLKKYKAKMAKAKRMILDGVKDHAVCHVASRGTTKEMWDALATLYQGSSEQRKMYLEQKLRSAQMQKGEHVDPFLTKLKETHEWQVFVQSILDNATLPNWDEMWADLKQELRRDLVKVKLDESNNNSGSKPKEEEDNAALASKGQQEQRRRKKDILKIKCFSCGEMGHYAT